VLQVPLLTLPGASIDPVTGLPDHRSFVEGIEHARLRCRRDDDTLTVVLLDPDAFRQINETHSHAVGDRVLALIARAIRAQCRRDELICRYRWDQFALALSSVTEAQALAVAERCRQSIDTEIVRHGLASSWFGSSAGIAQSGRACVETCRALIDRATDAVAMAKARGGNRSVLWSQLKSTSSIGASAPCSRNGRRAANADVAWDANAAERWMLRFRRSLQRTCLESIETLIATVEAKDPYTRRHSLTVSTYCEALGRRLAMPAAQVESLRKAAILHDIGKIGIPDAVLRKPGALTPDEFELVKRHPRVACDILRPASFLSDELPIILHHHERFDGKGYPDGLSGAAIPLGARVLAVADAIDTMLSSRSYKSPFTPDQVRSELARCSGTQFDPQIASAAIQWLDECSDADVSAPVAEPVHSYAC